jgi:hypothetical protein
MADFDSDFAHILAHFNKEDIDLEAFADSFSRFRDALEQVLLVGRSPVQISRGAAQSKQFMIQILPYVHEYMKQFPYDRAFTILDVGPGAGHGAELLGSLYCGGILGYRAQVKTIDIDGLYKNYIRAFHRHVVHNVGDIFDFQEASDIVIASHVIEHVPHPLPFVRRLQRLSRGIVIICAPYREDPAIRSPGHLQIFDDRFLEQLGATSIDLTESPAWGQFLKPPYKMFIACLPGEALSPEGTAP